MRVGHVLVGQGGHMHQAVVVHPHVDECAECGHIGDGSLQDHAGGEVGKLFDAFLEGGGGEFGTGVAPGLVQLGENVGDGGDAEGVVGKVRRLEPGQDRGVADQVGHAQAGGFGDAAHHRVGLGVDRGSVERVTAAGDAEEPGALFEGLWPQAGHVFQAGPVGEHPIGVPVGDNVVGDGVGDAGNPSQEGHGGGVEVHPHGVHSVFDHGVQGFRQGGLVHVVLVLAHPNGLGVDLHQLGKGVLEAAGDRDRAPEGHIHVGEFGGRDLGGGVHGSPGFADHDGCGSGAAGLGNEVGDLAGELFGFPAGGAIADGDEVHMVGGAFVGEGLHRMRPLVLGLVGVHDEGAEHFAGAVDCGAFDAVAVAGVQPQGGALASWGGEQHVLQVAGEDFEGGLLGGFLQPHANVQAGGNIELGFPPPPDGVRQPRRRRIKFELVGDYAAIMIVVTSIEIEV